ncbi:unnamed protein product [Rodentolepis nana]|uniref:Uncharacterized protein n=1 Tax=Rodentolepis nana TaxID=102285 RepID=A0A0R3TJW5_RODNA|nr:unnamed protein product [Rodentolepis nana]
MIKRKMTHHRKSVYWTYNLWLIATLTSKFSELERLPTFN